MRLVSALALGLACWSLTSVADARDFRVQDLPNGARLGCDNCHSTNPIVFNDFGSLALAHLEGSGPPQQKHVDWSGLCPTDPDGDGWTSGEELGDPDCTWVRGDPDPGGTTSAPGSEFSSPGSVCGNGVLDSGEECEGAKLAVISCFDMNAGIGDLSCKEDCTFNYSDCSNPPDGAGDDDDGATAPASGCALSGRSSGSVQLFALLALGGAALRRRRRAVSGARAA